MLGNLGKTYDNSGNVKRAIECLDQSLNIARETGDIFNTAFASFNLASIYSRQEKITQALQLAQEAERIWTRLGSPHVKEARKLIARLQGDNTKKELTKEDLRQIADVIESFLNAESVDKMREAVIRYPFMTGSEFGIAIKKFIQGQAIPEEAFGFEQRMAWLQQIADEE